jgi:hypothetical protein
MGIRLRYRYYACFNAQNRGWDNSVPAGQFERSLTPHSPRVASPTEIGQRAEREQ